MRKRTALIASLLVLFSVAVAFAADWRIQPFDSIITENPTSAPPTHNWADSCSQLLGAPTLFWANSPETWKSTSWSSQDHVLLAQGVLSPPAGLIAFHYVNGFTSTATLNFGIDPSSTATFGTLIGAAGINVAPAYVVGSRGTRGFLSKYVPVSGLPIATPHPGFARSVFDGASINLMPNSVSPRTIMSWSVPATETISGEFELPSLSKSATFYIYACTAHCTSAYTSTAIRDPSHQRGYFPNATYLIHYDYTPEYIDTGGSAQESVGGPGGCTPNLVGTDILDPGPAPTLVGNFGVPVDIYGAAPFSAHSQRFSVNPRGGFPFIGAAWVQSLINPQTAATVSPGAYVLPTAQPPPISTPIPYPTSTSIANNGQSVILGFDRGSGHTIIYILPGGNSAPVLMWDYVITPVPVAPNRGSAEAHT